MMMKQKILKKYSLDFYDNNLQEKYCDSWMKYKILTFRFIIIFNSIIPTFSIFFLNIFPLKIWQNGLLGLGTVVSFASTYFVFVRKFKKFIDIGLLTQFFGMVVIPLESYIIQGFRGNMRFYCLGMYFQLIICLMLLMRTSFKFNFLFIFLFQLYPSVRINTSAESERRNEFLIVPIIHYFILLGINYFTEKYMKLDFYEKKKYQETLECFKTVVKHTLPVSISILDNGNNRIFSNDATQNLFKKNLSELNLDSDIKILSESVKEDVEFISPDKISENNFLPLAEISNAAVKRGNEEENFSSYSGFLTNVYLEDGQPKPIDLTIGPIKWEGKESVLLILSDNSTKKRIEYLKKLGDYKDKLLATVSHDLRTPLNGIIGMIKVCDELTLDSEVKRYLDFSRQLSQLLIFMINDILDFSQSCKGMLRLTKRWVFLEEIIQEVLKIIDFQAQSKRLTIQVIECSEFQFIKAYTDPNRVKQILLNLLGNAIKFTPEGGLIELIVENTLIADESSVVIKVKDTGIGIKKEDISKLFRLFGKLEQSNCEINTSGVGLGLTISQNLVSLLCSPHSEGRISVKSEPNQGSEFSFPIIGITVEKCEELESTKILEENRPSIASCNNISHPFLSEYILGAMNRNKTEHRSILIVDDDPINIVVEKNYVSGTNFNKIDAVYNGLEGLMAVQKSLSMNNLYNYILMDCNMPIMDGFEATKQIKNYCFEKGVAAPTVIGITANVSEKDKMECIKSGMDYYLTKPLKKEDLLEIFQKEAKNCETPSIKLIREQNEF